MGFHCTCTALQPYLRITSHYNKFDTLFFIRTFFVRGQVLGGASQRRGAGEDGMGGGRLVSCGTGR